jgi:hypothetical protein
MGYLHLALISTLSVMDVKLGMKVDRADKAGASWSLG